MLINLPPLSFLFEATVNDIYLFEFYKQLFIIQRNFFLLFSPILAIYT